MDDKKVEEILSQQRTFLHDLVGPLTVALGSSDFALKLLDKGETAKALEKIHKTSESLEKMTRLIDEQRVLVRSQLPSSTSEN